MDYIYVNGELYHYGIKGMKWGVRRYQKKDGSLTSAGKKRYSEDTASKQKSTHRSRLEAKYREKGMSQREAEIAANRRIKIEKVIAVTAGVTVTAAAAYVINKNIKERAEGVIKAGTKMQVIAGSDNKNFDRAFYTAYKDRDMTKYKGMYGRQIQGRGEFPHKFTLNADKDIRIVSKKTATDTFVDLYKNDPEFRKAFKSSNDDFINPLFGNPKSQNIHRIASGEMTDKQLRKQGYEAFNIGLVNHSPEGNAAAKKFYDKLKEQGYDAVMDINDQKYSGYNSKKPVIIFNKADKISVSDVKKLTKEQVDSNADKAVKDIVGTALAKEGAAYAGLYVGSKYATRTINSIKVDSYKLEHPDTKLTDAEILKMIEKK